MHASGGGLREEDYWKDEIEIYLKETVWADVYWNCLADDRD